MLSEDTKTPKLAPVPRRKNVTQQQCPLIIVRGRYFSFRKKQPLRATGPKERGGGRDTAFNIPLHAFRRIPHGTSRLES